MSEVFIELLNLSIMAGWLVLAVMLVRVLLNKAPKYIRCILWSLVGLRLVCPVSIESIFSLLPTGKVVEPTIVYDKEPVINSGIYMIDHTANTFMAESFAPNTGDSINPLQVAVFVATSIWVLGVAVMIAYCMIGYFFIKRRVFDATKFQDNVYECQRIETPFVLGVFRPRIYIPYHMDNEAKDYVIAHEKAHIKRGDHITKMLGFLILAVHWFNPLVWLAYVLYCKDIELACDEKVLKKIGDNEKKNYSKVLLEYSVSSKVIAACPLAFGGVSVKQRIKNVLNYKKPAFWIVIISVIVCIVVAICFMTSPKKEMTAGETDMEVAENDAVNEEGEDSLKPENNTNSNRYVPPTTSLYLMVDDALYYCAGASTETVAKCGVMDGEIETSVDKNEMPKQNNESNFGTGYGWQRERYNEVEVYMPYQGKEQWVRFVKEGTSPGETLFDETTVLVDTDEIFSVIMVNGSTGEKIETSRLMSDNTMNDLLEDYANLEFESLSADAVELPEEKVGWQYRLELYDADGKLLQIITPREDTIEIRTSGKNSKLESKIYDCSMNDTSYFLLEYMNFRFHPANGIAGVYTTLDKVDSEGFTVSVWNTTEKELLDGDAYAVSVDNDGKWESVETVEEEVAFNDVANKITAKSKYGKFVSWTEIYGSLEVGKKYKLTMDFYEENEDGEWVNYTQEYEFFL